MLTDYHVHLRPDEDDTTAAAYFTEANVDRYLEAAAAAGITELGASEHIHRFTQSLDIWRHPFWVEQAQDDLGSYCDFVAATPLRLGIEMDFVAGREDRIAAVLDAHEFDYVIGSVHFVRDQAVDWEVYDVWDKIADPDRVWKLYFDTLAEAARTGLYDILAHPDLVKVWGPERPLPERDPRFYYEPAVEAIAEVGVAVEGGASRLTSSTRRTPSPRCAWTPARPSPSPRTPTCPPTSGATTIARWRRCAAGVSRSSASSSGASAAWSRSADGGPGRDRVRQPPACRRSGFSAS